MNIKELLKDLDIKDIIKFIFYSPDKNARFKKIIGRPVLIKEEIKFQFEQFTDKQVFHKNIGTNELQDIISEYLKDFKKLSVQTKEFDYDIFVNKEGLKVLKHKKSSSNSTEPNLEHNKAKSYLLPQNTVIEPLVDLGLLTKEGKIIASKFDKYKQINRFLEIVDDVVKNLNTKKTINIIDFGCGKSYLTFILYYFLTQVKRLDICVVGLDLKQEVIDNCNLIAQKYKYEKLKFIAQDIKDYKASGEVDMVICLHACDTATDYALFNAVKWNAKSILAVPCCQHEVNARIQANSLSLLTKYGAVKERFSALITDVIRANLLEINNYSVQIMEFVDFGHSPKNLLIRAAKKPNDNKTKERAYNEIKKLLEEFNIQPTLCRLMKFNNLSF